MAITKRLLWPTIMAALGIVFFSTAQAQPEQASNTAAAKHQQEGMVHCRHWGMYHHLGMMGFMGPRMMWGYAYNPLGMLQLSDEQRSKIEAIRHDHRETQLKLIEKMMDEKDKIRDLMSADTRDPSTIGKAYEPVFILKRRMIENSVATMNKIEAVLTPQQQAKLKKFRHRGMGYGMMGY